MKARILVVMALAAASLLAAPPVDQMKSQALLIVVQFDVNGKKGGGMGSGFPIDSTHIVTNRHVCCFAPKGANVKIGVVISEKEIIEVKSAYSSENKDLAILELASPIKASPVTLASRQLLKEGQDVWAVGFPGASLNVGDLAAAFVPSISKGIVSKFLSSPPQVKGGAPVGHIQMTAAVNSGNSGGPLFDECGRVTGIVVAKALTSLGKGEAFAEGVNLAITVDELLPELDQQKVRYSQATGACEAGVGSSSISMIQVAALMTAATALMVALNKKTRTAVTHATRKLSHRDPPPSMPPSPAPATPRKMMLVGISGTYAGQRIPLSAKPCVLGRDPSIANLVYPNEAQHVSKRHCQVTCDPSGRVMLEDSWSSNGTFTSTGLRLAGGQPRELKPGERFYVGSQGNTFEVVAE